MATSQALAAREGRRRHRPEGGAHVLVAALFVCVLATGVGWPWTLFAVAAGCAAWALTQRFCRAALPRLFDRSPSGGTDPRSNGRPPGGNCEILDEARTTLARMRESSAGVADAQVAGTVRSFCDGAEHLVDDLARKPRHVGQASRQFLTYYVAAGRNIIDGYARLEGRGDLSSQIRSTLDRVMPALRDITGVLQKQQAGLLSDEAFDLDVELSLLRKTMTLDGLIDD